MGLPRSNLVKSKSTAAKPDSVPPASGVRALETAATIPQLTVIPISSASMADEEVNVHDATIPCSIPLENAPSTYDLLERAARLGPPRPTLESIVLPNDPILLKKMQPDAAERRARYRKIVKATLGACVALCVAAIVASAIAPSEASASSSSSDGSLVARTAPASLVVPVEKLDDTTRGKARSLSHIAASVKPHAKHR